MDAHFVLVARILVNESGFVDRKFALFRRQRDRTDHIGSGAMRRVDDGARALVNYFVVVSQDLDANALLGFLRLFLFLCC